MEHMDPSTLRTFKVPQCLRGTASNHGKSELIEEDPSLVESLCLLDLVRSTNDLLQCLSTCPEGAGELGLGIVLHEVNRDIRQKYRRFDSDMKHQIGEICSLPFERTVCASFRGFSFPPFVFPENRASGS